MKKDVKERRQPRKARTSKAKGKRKAPAPPSVVSENDEYDEPGVNPPVPPKMTVRPPVQCVM